MVLDGSGNLFGTATSGGPQGDGTVFELPAGSQTLTTLASFNGSNGATPQGNLIEDASGNGRFIHTLIGLPQPDGHRP
jgi:uncharacterized repeat protein (TIGR03803 family)